MSVTLRRRKFHGVHCSVERSLDTLRTVGLYTDQHLVIRLYEQQARWDANQLQRIIESS